MPTTINDENVISALHTVTLYSGQDADFGDVEYSTGWNARFDFDRPEYLPIEPDPWAPVLTDAPPPVPCAYIAPGTYFLTINSQGFKYVTRYEQWERQEADRNWNAAEGMSE